MTKQYERVIYLKGGENATRIHDKEALSKLKNVLTKEEYLAKHPEDIDNIRADEARREQYEKELYEAELIRQALLDQLAEEDAILDRVAEANMMQDIADGNIDMGEMMDDGGPYMRSLAERRRLIEQYKGLDGVVLPDGFESWSKTAQLNYIKGKRRNSK